MLRLFIGFLLALAALPQPTPPPAFEAADIRLNTSGAADSRGDLANGRLTIRNVPLRDLIAEAWTITRDDVIGPPWIDAIRVDVVAKTASPNIPDGELRKMLVTLMQQRMKLVSHVEQRERSVWALSVWKGSPKMTPSEMPAKPEDIDCSLTGGPSGVHYACNHMTMAMLAHKLPEFAEKYVDKRVVDETGLTGAWEIALDWTPFAQLEANGGLTLFAALQSQAGLQLQNKKLPVDVVVVDSIEKAPTDN